MGPIIITDIDGHYSSIFLVLKFPRQEIRLFPKSEWPQRDSNPPNILADLVDVQK